MSSLNCFASTNLAPPPSVSWWRLQNKPLAPAARWGETQRWRSGAFLPEGNRSFQIMFFYFSRGSTGGHVTQVNVRPLPGPATMRWKQKYEFLKTNLESILLSFKYSGDSWQQWFRIPDRSHQNTSFKHISRVKCILGNVLRGCFYMTFTVQTSGNCNLIKGDFKADPASHLPAFMYGQHLV